MEPLVMWTNSSFLISQDEENLLGLCKETFKHFQDMQANGVSA